MENCEGLTVATNKAPTRTCVFFNPESEKIDEDYGCMGEFVPGRSDSPFCPRCRANGSYWSRADKKRPGSMRRYRNKLACRHARLDEWSGIYTRTNTKSKVIEITNARRKRHG